MSIPHNSEIEILIKLKHPDPNTDTLAFIDSLPDEVLIRWSKEYGAMAFISLPFDKKTEIIMGMLFDYYEQQYNE